MEHHRNRLRARCVDITGSMDEQVVMNIFNGLTLGNAGELRPRRGHRNKFEFRFAYRLGGGRVFVGERERWSEWMWHCRH